MASQLETMMGAERYERWGADISNTMRFRLLGELQLRYGAAWQLEDVRPADRQNDAGAESVRDGERSEVSVFTALQWKPWPILTLDAGLRYSDFSADDRSPPFIPADNSSQCIDLDGDGACDQISVHHTAGSGGTPLASVIWEPLSGLRFYALYAEAMRMPSLFESTRGFSATQAFDVAVKPEHAYNREIGINLLRDGLLFSQDKLRVKAAWRARATTILKSAITAAITVTTAQTMASLTATSTT